MKFTVNVASEAIDDMVKQYVVSHLATQINRLVTGVIEDKIKEIRKPVIELTEKLFKEKLEEKDLKTWVDETAERILRERLSDE